MQKTLSLCLAIVCSACAMAHEGDPLAEPTDGQNTARESSGVDIAAPDMPAPYEGERAKEDDIMDGSRIVVGMYRDDAIRDVPTPDNDTMMQDVENDAPPDAAEPDADPEGIDAETTLPTLEFFYDGPAAKDVYMGEAADMFCFSLAAFGADLDVALPVSEIRGVDDASIHTDSKMGIVFGMGAITEGSTFVTETGKVRVTDDALVYDILPWEHFTVPQGTIHHFCLAVDVTEWSATPDDFYGKSFRFVLGAWAEDSVHVAGSQEAVPVERIVFGGCRASSPCTQSVGTWRIAGNDMRIVSRDGSTHPERYSGTLHAALDPHSPAGMNLLPGSPAVQMTSVTFTADGTGSCVRSINVTDTGTGTDGDIDTLEFIITPTDGNPGSRLARGTAFKDGMSLVYYQDGGFLFCLDGEESASFTFEANFSDDAVIDGQHRLGIWDLSDIEVVHGTVTGEIPAAGHVFTVVSPNH